jgi:hypothetical protein
LNGLRERLAAHLVRSTEMSLQVDSLLNAQRLNILRLERENARLLLLEEMVRNMAKIDPVCRCMMAQFDADMGSMDVEGL